MESARRPLPNETNEEKKNLYQIFKAGLYYPASLYKENESSMIEAFSNMTCSAHAILSWTSWHIEVVIGNNQGVILLVLQLLS